MLGGGVTFQYHGNININYKDLVAFPFLSDKDKELPSFPFKVQIFHKMAVSESLTEGEQSKSPHTVVDTS